MVKTVTLNTEIPSNRELRIALPADVPTGPAAVAVTVPRPAPRPPRVLATFSNPSSSARGAIGPALQTVRSSQIDFARRAGSGGGLAVAQPERLHGNG